MASTVSTVALLAPVVTTNAVFSARRATKGVNAMDENPMYGAMNLDIAAGQVLKGTRAAMLMTPALSAGAGVNNSVFGLNMNNGFMKGVSKVVNFTADNINPLICVTSGVKVLGSEDKWDTAAREALALSAMFASEGAAKSILGMPAIKRVNGKTVSNKRDALYKRNEFLNKKVGAFENYCATKKLFNKISLEGLPPVLKGLGFVFASIFGYKLGAEIADKLLEKDGKQRDKN